MNETEDEIVESEGGTRLERVSLTPVALVNP